MVFGSIESNLIIRPAAKAESNPFYVPGTLFWPRVVTPDIAALKSVTPTVIDMGLDIEDTTLSPILPPSTTQSPVGSDLSVLILTVLTALCQRKGSADPACVQARSQLRGLSLSKVDNVQESPTDQYNPVVLQNLLVSLINDQASENERGRQGRQNVQGFSWSVFLQAVRGIGRFVKTVSGSGDVVGLLEEWLRRPAQKQVSPDQLKVFLDIFAMEALSAIQRDVKLLEISLFILIGTLMALVVILGIGWSVTSIRACRKEKKAARVKRKRSDADILLRNLQRSRRQQIMESQF